jgi:alginate O-acetyltransferase complex protein AlgI
VWGAYYGVLLTLEKLFFGKLLEKLPKLARRLLTFLIASIGWGIFSFTDFSALGTFFGALIGIGTRGILSPASAAWCLGFLPTLLVAAVSATPLGARTAKRLARFCWFEPVRLLACVVLFVLCIASLASQSYNPIIYFRF